MKQNILLTTAKILFKRSALGLIMCSVLVSKPLWANAFKDDDRYFSFKQQLVAEGISEAEIDQWMEGAQFLPNVNRIMSKPGENKEWYDYKQNFFTAYNYNKGAEFAAAYASELQRAELNFGVDRTVILGILGVETAYGRNMGSFLIRDALATLAFRSSQRQDYFQSELKALITLAHQNKLDPYRLKGSYAGAFGYGQFMPSSYRDYGVDFDGDGTVNLNKPVDAIGSIANYLRQKGWQLGQPVMVEARFTGADDQLVICKVLTQPQVAKALYALGLEPLYSPVYANDPVCGIRLNDTNGSKYFFTYNNFQVITTYNRSRMYATAVWQLGEKIRSFK